MAQTGKKIDVVKVSWTADAADGSVPNTPIPQLWGWLVKAITNPGSTAPTDNYDIKLLEPDDATADGAMGALADRDTANTESVSPCASGAAVPAFLAGDYTFNLTGNSVNSATGVLWLYITESL